MAKPGEVKINATPADVHAASRWLLSYIRSDPQGTVLTDPPAIDALCALASDLAIRAQRRHSDDRFTIVLPRARFLEFQRAYGPAKLAPEGAWTDFSTGADRFASAVDKALSGKAGRPALSRCDRQRRLVNPAPCFAVGKRQQTRLRRQDRIEDQQPQLAAASNGTILGGYDVAKFS